MWIASSSSYSACSPAALATASSASSRRQVFSRCASGLGRRQQQASPALSTSSFTSITSASKDSRELQLTLALIKPSVCSYQPDVSAILKEIKQSGLNVARSRRLFWTSTDAHAFYAEHRGRFYYDRLILGMISGPSMALALYGPDAIKRWRSMLGATKAYKSKWEDPQCLRARYGLGDTRNGFHGSDSTESAQRELGLLFDGWDTQWWLQREQGKLPVDADGKMNPLGF